MKTLLTIAAATILATSTAVSADWDDNNWNNNWNNNGWGNGWGDMMGDGDFSMSFSGRGRGNGYGYGNNAWDGSNGWNGYNGGYGPGYNELLVWRGTVGNTGATTQVDVTATVNHNTEPGYDFSNLGYYKADASIAYIWTADGEGELVPGDAAAVVADADQAGAAVLDLHRQPVHVVPGRPPGPVHGFGTHLRDDPGPEQRGLATALAADDATSGVESMRLSESATFDDAAWEPFVTARAFAPLPKLLDYAAPWMKRGATGLFLKGERWKEELTEAKQRWSFAQEAIPSRVGGSGTILIVRELRGGRQ